MQKKKINYQKSCFCLLSFLFVFCLSFAVFDKSFVFAVAPDDMPRGVTVVYNGDIYSQRGFAWYSGKSITDCRVEYIEKTEGLNAQDIDWQSAAVKTANGDYSGAKGENAKSLYNNYKALVTGLEAGKSYYYRVGSPSANAYTKTAVLQIGSKKQDTVTFINVADPQSTNKTEFYGVSQVLNSATDTIEDIDFFLCNGDNVNDYHNLEDLRFFQWQDYLQESEDIFMNYPFMSLAGNHESKDYGFYDRFNYDFAAPSIATAATSLYSGGYYSFEYNDIFFVFLNTNESLYPSSAQSKWLKEQLSKTTAQWKIVAMHESAVTTGHYYGTSQTDNHRINLFPIMSEYKVDLVLQGHNHCYMRSNPYLWESDGGNTPNTTADIISEIYDGTQIDYAVEPDGTVYTIINYIGHKQNALKDYGSEVSVAYNPIKQTIATATPNLPMFSAYTIEGNKLTYRAYTVTRTSSSIGTATLFDTYGIIKNTQTPVEKMIDELPEAVSAEFYDAPSIQAAKAAYDELLPVAQAKLSSQSIQKLEDLLAKIDIKSSLKVLSVEQQIEDLSMPSLSAEFKSLLSDAINAYNKLTTAERQLVRNYAKIGEAEQIISDLTYADGVIKFIAAIDPSASDFAQKTAAAKIAYNRLNSTQKAYVTNYAELSAYEKLIQDDNSNCNKTTASFAFFSMLMLSFVFIKKTI